MATLRIIHLAIDPHPQVHEGMEAVLASLRLDAFVSVRLKGGKYVSGSIAPIPSAELPKFGFTPNGYPVYLIQAEEGRAKLGRFARTFELIDWDSIDAITQCSGNSIPNLVERHLGRQVE